MLHLRTLQPLGQPAVRLPKFWEITAGFASKAARKRSRQAEAQPFSKALLQFHDHVMSPQLQLNSAATKVNERSLSKLLDFVKSLASSTNTYPPAMAEPITIMVRDTATGKPRTMSTLLRTTGGDCSQSVARTLSGLFAAAGAPSDFHWDEGMWVLTSKKADEAGVQAARAKAAAAGIPSSEPMTLSEMEAVQAKMDAKKAPYSGLRSSKFSAGETFLSPTTSAIPASPGSPPQLAGQSDDALQASTVASSDLHSSLMDSQAACQQQQLTVDDAVASTSSNDASPGSLQSSIDEAESDDAGAPIAEGDLDEGQMAAFREELQKLDPLLAALAAVPWIDPNAEDGQRVPFIKSTVLDQVEGMGWDVRGGATKIWAGERDLDNILLNKDTGSAIALKTIMQYTLKFEQDFGSNSL